MITRAALTSRVLADLSNIISTELGEMGTVGVAMAVVIVHPRRKKS